MRNSEDQAFWRATATAAQGAAIGAIGVAGLFEAAASRDRIGYLCGLGAFVAAALLLFWAIHRHAEGAAPLRLADLVVDDFAALALALPLLGVTALAGLVLAARAQGGAGYYAGLGLAVGAIAIAFVSIRVCFEAAARREAQNLKG